MNDASDSDDSAFLFTTSFSKRKVKINIDETERAMSNYDLQRNDITNLKNEETKSSNKEGSSTDQNNSTVVNGDLNVAKSEISVIDEDSTLKNENNIQQTSKLVKSKITDYYSCPLCLKTFDTEILHISHMKQCAKKSKMTPKQLLQALEMHKGQLKRRLQLGLSSPMKKKRKTGNQDNQGSEYELALGLALSKSLSEVNQNPTGSHNLSCKSNKTTLESFGFTSSNCNFGGTGRKKVKNWKNIQFALRERTKEQRERLVTEKAAVILLCKDYEFESCKKPEQGGLCDLENIQLRENKQESLWKLGEREDNTKWYVESIKPFMADESGENTQNSEDCEIDGEIKNLNLPRISVTQDWKKLVNNAHMSDLNFRSKSCETFYLHSIVLYVRCPTMLGLDLESALGGFNTVTVLSFLQYLYCGVLDGLKKSEIEDLLRLARSVNFEELCQVLGILQENLNLKPSESAETGETRSELSGTSCDKEENLGNDLDENPKSENNSHREEQLKIHSSVSDCNANNSLQESVAENCSVKDVENESNQNLLKSLEDDEVASWKQNEMENLVNHMEIEERVPASLNGEENTNLPSSLDETLTPDHGLSNECGETDILDGDMFEEEDTLNRVNSVWDTLNISPPRREDNVNECIIISSGSSKGGETNEERAEEIIGQNEDFPMTDCEIPYFDPYEYFNGDIPISDSPTPNDDHTLRSQSLFQNEISRVKLSSPCIGNSACDKSNDFPELETVSPIPKPSTSRVSEFCSTPISRLNASPPSSHRDRSGRRCSRTGQKRKSLSVRYKRSRPVIASRLARSRILKSGSAKKKRNTSKCVQNNEEDSGEETDILTESVLKDMDGSFGTSQGENADTMGRKFIEMTPAATGEKFSEDVSPLPDYSMMDASGIKKHLARYGLKKSLSKNKAKKILRHIYEELHPLINTRNGKIIKYEPVEKKKQPGKKSDRKRRKSSTGKKLQSVRGKRKNEAGIRETCQNPEEDLPEDRSGVIESKAEDEDSFEGTEGSLERSEENIFEISDSEIQECQSQSDCSSAKDVTEAVVDFIYGNQEIHRRILMYEPIWLEKFRLQLYEKYNKKYKITDIMDCLDAECITFRCEKQTRTNRIRKMKRTKSSNLKKK